MTIDRRQVITWPLAAALGGNAGDAVTVPPKRVVVQSEPIFNEKRRARLVKNFADRGFIDGRDISIEIVDFGSDPREYLARARSVVASRPDLIIAAGDDAAMFKQFTSEIPIVFHTLGADPVRLGLVRSLRHPGGNLTGTLDGSAVLPPKAWSWPRKYAPRSSGSGYCATHPKATCFGASREKPNRKPRAS